MPIHHVNNFLYADDIGCAPMIGIESSRIRECIEEVSRREIRGVFGAPPYFKETNFDFLIKLKDLKQLWFYEVKISNCDGIYHHPNLELFCAYHRTAGIDFKHFSKLKHLVWHHQSKDSNIESLLNLRQLDVWHYNTKRKSFSELAIPTNLEHLEISWANPASLEGLPIMPQLKELQLAYCKLDSLDGIDKIAPNLERLVIQNCKKLGKLDDQPIIKKLSRLTFAFINKTPAFGKR